MRRLPTPATWKILCLLWGSIICWLSLTPSPPQLSTPVLGWDKAQHAAAYALLAYLALSAFAHARGSFRSTAGILVSVVLFGGLIELAQQQLTVNRTADILDFIANTIGAVSASVLYCLPIIFRRCGGEQQ